MPTATNSIRYIVVMTTVINVLFSFSSRFLLAGSKGVGQITYHYESLFMPARYAFYIWFAIYLGILVYSIVQLLPSRRNMKFYDEMAFSVVAFNILTVARVTSHVTMQVGFSSFILVCMLIAAVIAFTKAKKGVLNEGAKQVILAPFALLLGWLSVAMVANMSLWLETLQWNGLGITEPVWVVLMIVILSLLSLAFAYREGSFIFPTTVAWGIFALYVRHTPNYPVICTTAIVASAVVTLAGIVFFIYRRPKPKVVEEQASELVSA